MKTPNRASLYHDHVPLRTHTPTHDSCQPRQPARTPITSTAILKAVLNGLVALCAEDANAKLGLPPTSDPATQRLLTSTRAFLRKHRLHAASHAALRAGGSPSCPAVAAASGVAHAHWWQGGGPGAGAGARTAAALASGGGGAERDVLRQACPGCKGMRTVKAYCELQLKVAMASEDHERIRQIQGAIRELDRC